MVDVFSPKKRSLIMAAVRSRGNRSTELSLVAAFRAARITGWRRHYAVIGTPDFAFPKLRLAIFVDGCFWHGCPRCGSIPVTNRVYWQTKILRNMKRDKAQTKILRARGWKVIRLWEHDLRTHGIPKAMKRIQKALA